MKILRQTPPPSKWNKFKKKFKKIGWVIFWIVCILSFIVNLADSKFLAFFAATLFFGSFMHH